MNDQKKYSVPTLCVAVPCYNEQEILKITSDALAGIMSGMMSAGKIKTDSFVAFIDDGSKDATWKTIFDLVSGNNLFRGLKLSRNFGHQNALLAGLYTFHSEADCVVSIDADLQDDVSVIETMVEKFSEGYEVVYGVRKNRDTDSIIKKYTALGFYNLMRMMGAEVVYNHADFRLASKKVIEELRKYNEVHLFLRGIFPTIGYSSTSVYYDRKKRLAGESKYPFLKMIAFAFDGITSFSIKPLRLVTSAGIVIFTASLVVSAYVVWAYMYLDVVHGWASTVLPVYLLAGIQLLGIGIIGEYVGKIYKEVKARPRFIVEKVI